MQWFRMYSEILQDPKVQQMPAALFKHWVNLLALANTSEPRGTLPPLEDVAFALRVKPSAAKTILTRLVERGLLDRSEDGQISAHNWTHRQRDSDDSKPRVQRHRVKNQTETSSNGAHLEPDCNGTESVTVTAPEAEADSDTETDIAAADARATLDDQAPDAAAVKQVERQFCVIAGRTMASSNDLIAITHALQLARGHPETVIAAMKAVWNRRRAKGERGRVTSFAYFIPAIEEATAASPSAPSVAGEPAGPRKYDNLIRG